MDQLFGLQHRRNIPPSKVSPLGEDANPGFGKTQIHAMFWQAGIGLYCLMGAMPPIPNSKTFLRSFVSKSVFALFLLFRFSF